MTREQFQADAELRASLRKILDDSIFQTAVDLVMRSREARAGDLDRDPVSKAAKYDQRAGANQLVADLQALAEPAKTKKQIRGRSLAVSEEDLPKPTEDQ